MKSSEAFKPVYGNLVFLARRDPSLLREFYAKRFREDVLEWADVWPKNPSYEEVRLRFEEQERSPREWRLWIHTRQGKLIGEVSLTDINHSRHTAEFSVVLFDPGYWGRGFGTEASRLFLKDAASRFNLETIYLYTAQQNRRAIGSFEKLGFRVTERLMLERERFVKMELESSDLITS